MVTSYRSGTVLPTNTASSAKTEPSPTGSGVTMRAERTPGSQWAAVLNRLSYAKASSKGFTSITEPLHVLAADADLVLAGAGASPAIARATGATLLESGPVPAALHIATLPSRGTHTG